ncbi:helix-turn-helix transcriptional regulator [Ornithinibacillus sp. JPR2-1]|uniref:helix-turn-helix transcriptional regulator n=1 Tax=Ornithinibacillus sp. JPR2-1 TaxID=2094019 RepID=UPI0031D946F7
MKNRIKEFREKKHLSQGKVADLCNVSRQTINAIENDKYDPSLQLAFDLASVLGVKVDELFISDRSIPVMKKFED